VGIELDKWASNQPELLRTSARRKSDITLIPIEDDGIVKKKLSVFVGTLGKMHLNLIGRTSKP
jgi:hypothetical protein